MKSVFISYLLLFSPFIIVVFYYFYRDNIAYSFPKQYIKQVRVAAFIAPWLVWTSMIISEKFIPAVYLSGTITSALSFIIIITILETVKWQVAYLLVIVIYYIIYAIWLFLLCWE